MTNDKDSAVTQADIDAAKLYLQGTGPWALDEIGIGPDDSLVQAFARHRQYGYDQGYYDGRKMDAMEERAKIVAYARGHGGNAWSRDVLYFAEKVEAGEHLQEQSK